MCCDNIKKSRGDVGDRFIPRSRCEATLALSPNPTHRGEQSFWMVSPFEVAIDLRAEEALRHWMVMRTAQFDSHTIDHLSLE
jgi:hypothetical protein